MAAADARPTRFEAAKQVARRLAADLPKGYRISLVTFSAASAVVTPPTHDATLFRQALEFLAPHVPANVSPMCGNSICQDRRFLARWMPRLEGYFHYRNLDVSTLKELVRRWKPELAKGFTKEGKHEALADILESLEELKFYRKTVMTI